MTTARPKMRIGYVLKRFPRLSQTFVLNELLELEGQGVEIEVFSLLDPPDEPRHDLVSTLAARVTCLSELRPGADAVVTTSEGRARRSAPLVSCLTKARGGLAGVPAGKSEEAVARLAWQSTGLALLAAERGCSHLHAHFASDATTVAMLASRLSGIPYSFTAHARDIYRTYVDPVRDAAARRMKIAEARFVVTVSEFNRRHLRDLAGREHAIKVMRLYNGVDLKRLAFVDMREREPGLVLAVGRLVEKKGFEDLLGGLAAMPDHGPPWRCVIVGDGPLEARLRSAAAALGIADRVTFAGARPQSDVIALMQRASVLALPCLVDAEGDRDGLPTVLLEALACGLPVVSTDIAGIPEIVTDGRSGLLVGQRRPDLVAHALHAVLAQPEFAAGLAREGRVKAQRDFDLRTNVATLRDLFVRSATDRMPLPREVSRNLMH